MSLQIKLFPMLPLSDSIKSGRKMISLNSRQPCTFALNSQVMFEHQSTHLRLTNHLLERTYNDGDLTAFKEGSNVIISHSHTVSFVYRIACSIMVPLHVLTTCSAHIHTVTTHSPRPPTLSARPCPSQLSLTLGDLSSLFYLDSTYKRPALSGGGACFSTEPSTKMLSLLFVLFLGNNSLQS